MPQVVRVVGFRQHGKLLFWGQLQHWIISQHQPNDVRSVHGIDPLGSSFLVLYIKSCWRMVRGDETVA